MLTLALTLTLLAAQPCTVTGTAGADYLTGTNGADVIRGGPGADRIEGGLGRDVLLGEGGADKIWAWDAMRDRVDGGAGVDWAMFDRPWDTVVSVERRGR